MSRFVGGELAHLAIESMRLASNGSAVTTANSAELLPELPHVALADPRVRAWAILPEGLIRSVLAVDSIQAIDAVLQSLHLHLIGERLRRVVRPFGKASAIAGRVV